ncbi:hypothetical protein Dform_00528 [Dehalogenimonas formicexedens]|uniref:Uncharacterized protein n=1 Tax=Dehalogenimonas formicexedens TaxID=1839801 RepID=A0A1P8F5Y2_9CHLR|nr:helix-turn-helix domain-containing protein [Dehalogenimonas formicexedens]APV43883.1 hypothetical protein Dform_00528 [Dehalogenimonas formicexedens]
MDKSAKLGQIGGLFVDENVLSERTYGVQEASIILGFDREGRTVRRHINSGLIKATKIGTHGKWHILESEIIRVKAGKPNQKPLVVPSDLDNNSSQSQVKPNGAYQKEHIASLQELARKTWDSANLIGDIDDPTHLEVKENAYFKALTYLISDSRWPMLAGHLGAQARRLELTRDSLFLPSQDGKGSASLETRMERVNMAYPLIVSGGLEVIAFYGDENAWPKFGLNSKCQWCPQQTIHPSP